MKMNQCLKKISKVMKKCGYAVELTEDNLSIWLKELLEQYPTLLENEIPDIYNNLIVIVDLDNIK